MVGLEKIYCEIIQKEPGWLGPLRRKELPVLSEWIHRKKLPIPVLFLEPPTFYFGNVTNGKTVSIKKDDSDPLNLEIGDTIEIERRTRLGMFHHDEIVYPDGRKKHIHMQYVKK